jgi:hypothetical protein
MKKMNNIRTQSLIKTNPYLRNSAECDVWITRAVISSSAIEGAGAAARRALGVTKHTGKAKVSGVVSGSSRSHR